jgi:hypothetical protein
MPKKITIEQAYVLGLITSGGTIANGTFQIVMPFDKWGANPTTAAAISKDLLTKVRALFSTAYKIDINYSLGNKNRWVLSPLGNPNINLILADLSLLGLPTTGQLLNNADLVLAKKTLNGMRAEHFITGIFDARASLTESHRRFNNDSPVVSVEIPGSTMNFKFVVQLCAWLTDLGSVTDQILFNHPSQHASSDPTYKNWKKGFKIRFLAKSFLSKHSFAMKAKASDVITLANQQISHEQLPCSVRHVSANTVSIHDDINDSTLPGEVRGKLFLHYHHICAAMGCPHAPLAEVQRIMGQAATHVSVYPLLSKGGFKESLAVHLKLATSSFPTSLIIKHSLSCENILKNHSLDYTSLNIALAYLLSSNLNGKRHVGSMGPILLDNAHVVLEVREITGVGSAPLFIGNRSLDRGVVVSCPTGSANAIALKSKVNINGIEIRVI